LNQASELARIAPHGSSAQESYRSRRPDALDLALGDEATPIGAAIRLG
jgi:hypothetical protein